MLSVVLKKNLHLSYEDICVKELDRVRQWVNRLCLIELRV